jgi:Ca2+-binding EF-hand superfamily protein
MQYERCTQRKLRALFEYLDTDRDGHITHDGLSKGINQLQSYGNDDYDPNIPITCEYNVEEILRSIPSADAQGKISLDAFLSAEATLLPQLSRLRLLT